MAASHSHELKSAPAPLTKHPAIVAFEQFYESQTIIKAAQLFIAGNDPQADMNFEVRMYYLLPKEKETLAEWADEQYGHYIESKSEDNPRLSPRQRTWLAIMHTEGLGTLINEEKAQALFQQAAGEGDGCAYYNLAALTNNIPEKIKLLTKSYEKGYIKGLNALALEKEAEEPQQAVIDYQLAADLGSGAAMHNLGLCYNKGDLNLIPDFKQAADFFLKAATKGETVALSMLGMMHDEAKLGDRNIDLVIQFYEAAIKRDPTLKAQYHLGVIFRDEKKDTDKAARHFRYSALTEHKDAKKGLWNLFREEKTTPSICFHAAIAFHKVGTQEQKTATRAAFNDLVKANVDIVNELYSEDESPDDIQALIDLDEKEIEKVRILFNIIRSPDLFINDIAAIMLAYVNPLKPISDKVAKEEVAIQQFLNTQKPLPSGIMITVWGEQARHHRAIIQDAEEHKISYAMAKKKIVGR